MKKTTISHAIGLAVGTAFLFTTPAVFAADINDTDFYTFTPAIITTIAPGTVVGTLTDTDATKTFTKNVAINGSDGICFDDAALTITPSGNTVTIGIKPNTNGEIELNTDVLSTTFCRLDDNGGNITVGGRTCTTASTTNFRDAPYEVRLPTKDCGAQTATRTLNAASFKDNLKAVNSNGTDNNNFTFRINGNGIIEVVALNATGGDFYIAGVAAENGLGVDMQQPTKDTVETTSPPPATPIYNLTASKIYLNQISDDYTLGNISNYDATLTYAITPNNALKIVNNQIQVKDKTKLSAGTLNFSITANNGSVSPPATGSIIVEETAPQSNCTEGTEILSTSGPNGDLMWELKSPTSGNNDMHGKNHTYTWRNTNSNENEGVPGSVGNWSTCKYSLGVALGKECNTLNFVNEVNSKNYCGFSNWRLPTQAELQHLRSLHSANGITLPDLGTSGVVGANVYWTSESGKASDYASVAAYVVDFGSADIQYSDKVNQEKIRLVRSK